MNWLLRQVKTAPDLLRVDCFALHGRGASTSELLKAVRENPALLVDDPKREIRTFRLILSGPMGTKRGQGCGSFVTSVLDLLDGFYGEVIQGIKPGAGVSSKLRSTAPELPEPVVPAALASTSLSSQDGPETGTVSPNVPVRADEAPLAAGSLAVGAIPSSPEATVVSDGAPPL